MIAADTPFELQFPNLLETLAKLRAAVRGLPKFGAPFGYNHENESPAQPQGTPTRSVAPRGTSHISASSPPRTDVRQATVVSMSSTATNPAATDAPTLPRTTAIKRPSPSAQPGSPHPAEPASKRPRSTELPASTSTTLFSRNVRPIIPVGVTTTQGASVIQASSALTAELSSC